jgi:hypothetical protein
MDINGKTKIGLFTVIGSLPVLVGGIMWLTYMSSKVEAAEKSNDRQDSKIEAQQNILLDIRERVIRIEEKITKEK